jgi:hypothetical protein
MNHLQAVLLQEYAVRRLEDRQMGESLGNPIRRVDTDRYAYYISETGLPITDDETKINIPPQDPFCLIPIIPKSVNSINHQLRIALKRANEAGIGAHPVFVLPMDFIYLDDDLQKKYIDEIKRGGAQLIVVGLTTAQLMTEAEFNLSVTAAQSDPDDLDFTNVDRYPD